MEILVCHSDSTTDQTDRMVIEAANYLIQGFIYTIFNALQFHLIV